jgi:hypothetical protein
MLKPLLPAMLALPLLAALAPPLDPVPEFNDPLTVDNAFATFVPGAVKLYRGKEEGVRTAGIDTFTELTRDFEWNGNTVATRVLEEKDFEAGLLVEISYSYHAQADDGSVYLFGEVSWAVEGGVPTTAEADSWLVGGPTQPADPPAAHDATDPALVMPATLEVGQVFGHEAFPGAAETATVMAVDVNVQTAAGKFSGAVRLTEIDDGEDAGDKEIRWVVPGVGIVKEKSDNSRRELLATSLAGDAAEETGP